MTLLDELERIVGVGEHVIYRGKPDKKCFIYESIFNPMLPIALIWGILDFGFMFGATSATSGAGFSGMLMFLIPFFALHLMPVWIYLGGVLLSAARHRNTAYIVTDQAIYVAKGVFSHTITRKPFAELSYINIHRGVFDRMFGVGDVIATTFDIRMKEPNREPVINIAEIHTIEHLGATFLRNHPKYKNETIYFGPMGCRTGFYVIFKGELDSKDIVEIIKEMFSFIAEYEGKVLDKLDKQNCILRDILDKLKFWNFR